MVIFLFALLFALIGAPVFGVMCGVTQLAWLQHENEAMRFLRFLAPDVLDDRFAGSPILVTVPLFTFVGYLMAESKTPNRIVRAAQAVFGWIPGGLAIVCIFASAFFTTFTGGSAVTIVAIGALLYPALIQSGYPERFALGIVMTSGSVGLLLPPSLPILVYSLVAGIDFNKGFKSGIVPGLVVIALLSSYAAYIAIKNKIATTKFSASEAGAAVWELKWELLVPILVLAGLGTGLTEIDEAAALAALYGAIIEVYVYKDIHPRQFVRIARNAMGLAGALLLIMAMAMALTNFIVTEQIPEKVYVALTEMGVSKRWHFLIVLNLFLYLQGMVMDGFSTIFVTVPLLIPFAAQFAIQPFHMAMMFLLNMEIGYLSPPLGQNLFVTSFRFNKPMILLYRVCLPFLALMAVGLVIIIGIPKLSTFAVEGDIARAKARAAQFGEPPREAWLMECVQEDRNNPLPCTDEEKKTWLDGEGNVRESLKAEPVEAAKQEEKEPADGEEDLDSLFEEGGDEGSGSTEEDLDKLFEDAPAASADAPGDEKPPVEGTPVSDPKGGKEENLDELFK